MRFTTILVPTALSFAAGCSAWAQHSNGVWVANNNLYTIGSDKVHEACTRKDSNEYWAGDRGCAYWVDGNGNIFNGRCQEFWVNNQKFITCR